MESARTGFCCTFVSPAGDEDEQRLLNMRQPTVASVARADVAGEAARAAGVRLSMHPAQHAILASGNPGVIDNAIHDIEDLLQVADEVAIVVDFHHHWIHSRGERLQPDDRRIGAVRSSWRGVRPLSHVSVSREILLNDHDPDRDRLPDFAELEAQGHKPSKLRGHSDRMWNRAVNRLVAGHLAWTDVEVEAKAKSLASRDLADQLRSESTALT